MRREKARHIRLSEDGNGVRAGLNLAGAAFGEEINCFGSGSSISEWRCRYGIRTRKEKGEGSLGTPPGAAPALRVRGSGRGHKTSCFEIFRRLLLTDSLIRGSLDPARALGSGAGSSGDAMPPGIPEEPPSIWMRPIIQKPRRQRHVRVPVQVLPILTRPRDHRNSQLRL